VQKLDDARLRDLYRQMVLIRRFDELVLEHRLANKIYGVVHPYIGEEAVAVGVCAALRVSDRIVSTHRGHGHCIAKGADINRMLAELYGRRDGYCKGKGGSMHIADFAIGMLGANGIVAGGMPIAAGAALAAQFEGKGNVAVSFFGDGATAEGAFHEAVNLSATWKLPIVFVCENNLYATDSAYAETQPVPNVAARAGAYGIPGVTIDGNDLFAVYESAWQAVENARAGKGPSIVECTTYRYGAHNQFGTRPPEGRPPEELARWHAHDPITLLQRKLIDRGAMKPGDVARVEDEVRNKLEEGVRFAEASPFPSPQDALTDMFV
jgi:TPP-dependent pyruvate/acetoin dehydrogenase alpha subunit